METIKYNSMLRFVPQHFFPAEYECSIGVLIINNNMNAQRKIPQTPVTDNNRSEKEEGQPTKALSNATSSNITITLKYDFSNLNFYQLTDENLFFYKDGEGSA